jgi:hypothetical protein
LTGVTLSATMAAADSCAESDTKKTNASLPLKSWCGVYVRFGAVPVSVPFSGATMIW